MKKIEQIILGIILLVSILFQIHNINSYNPDMGFDGKDHQAYISWIANNHNLPNASLDWEFTQTPLYYTIGAIFKTISIDPQFVNFIVYISLVFILYRFTKSFIVILGFLSLPMANYLVPQISNEYLSGLWIVLALFQILKILESKDSKSFLKRILISSIVIVFGFYTKYTALSTIPVMILAALLNKQFSLNTKIKNLAISGILILVLISPILIRNYSLYRKPFVLAPDVAIMGGVETKRDLLFFTRLDWIYRADIYGAKSYSFLGGLWNTMWHDGENSISPVVSFHKKAFGLWVLGFPLFVMSLVGLIKIYKKEKYIGVILFFYLLIALMSLIQYNIFLPYDYVLKTFYAFGIVVPYILGFAEFSKIGKWSYRLTVVLLLIQFGLLISYFWIQPWWHVAK